MTYDEFIAQLQTRVTAAFTNLRTQLIAAGLPANRVTTDVPDTNDFRVRITATRNARTIIAYVEFTSVDVVEGEMRAILTLWVEGNGTEITSSYTAGVPLKYLTQLDGLVAKLADFENALPEVAVKVRAFLGV